MVESELDDEEDDWNIRLASFLLIDQIMVILKDGLHDDVFNFFLENIQSNSWHTQHAALLALSAILPNCSESLVWQSIQGYIQPLIGLMSSNTGKIREITSSIL